MDYPQQRLFNSKISTTISSSPTSITTIPKEQKCFIKQQTKSKDFEMNLRILFDKNIALENLDYLDHYCSPDDDNQSISLPSTTNINNKSFFSNSSSEVFYF